MMKVMLGLCLSVAGLATSLRPHHQPQCVLDTIQEVASVCVRTPSTECSTEQTRNGIRIVTDSECYKVVRTVCTEDTEVVNNEVCATYYKEIKVQAEIKTVTAIFEKLCRDEEVCQPVDHYGAGTTEGCKTKRVCYKEPRLVPVVKKVGIALPRPEEKCVNYPILLPRLSCTQLEDRHCVKVPEVKEGLIININKCSVTYSEEECSDSLLSLPRQACPRKMTNIKNIYEYVEETGYERSG